MSHEAALTTDRSDRDRWLAIELRHLAALATVAQQSSFSGAADSLGYVQSAVSQQISSLERIVGRRLIDRSARPRSVTVTDAGKTLLDHIDEILEQIRLAKADVDTLQREPRRAVDIGIDGLFGSWLPAALLDALLPDAGDDGWGWDRVERGTAARLLEHVAAGRLDAAFVPLPIASGPFFALELARLPCVLVAPAEAAAHEGDVDAILERWPLVQVDGCPATKTLLAHRPDERSARSLHAATGPGSALSLVRSGAAAAVLTSTDVPADDATVTTVPIAALPARVVGLAWHRERDGCAEVAGLRAAAQRAFRRFASDGRGP
jgi:DNA-binding transcriptional LysR family regulator